jgi:hypothetical protein
LEGLSNLRNNFLLSSSFDTAYFQLANRRTYFKRKLYQAYGLQDIYTSDEEKVFAF